MNDQQTTLKQWLVSTPIFFALTSFLFAVTLSVLAGLLMPKSETTLSIIGTAMIVTTIISGILAIRRIPTHKMDRAGIVTIFNIKMIILVLMSVISLIMAFNLVPLQMWLLTLMQNPTGIIIGFLLAVCLVLLSLYILGVTIMGFWACFLRARTMKIPLWKIIFSIPFGFDMLWVPGYFIPAKQSKKPVVATNIKWISNLTNWTFARLSNAGFLFVALIIGTGIFNGLTTTLLSLSILLLFAIWIMQMGDKKFEKNIGNTYATTAVIINIVMIAYMIFTIWIL